MRFSPDGRTLVVGEEEGAVLWDVASCKKLRELPSYAEYLHCVAFSPDGKTVATGGSDGRVYLYEVASGKRGRKMGTWW